MHGNEIKLLLFTRTSQMLSAYIYIHIYIINASVGQSMTTIIQHASESKYFIYEVKNYSY